MRRRTRTKKPFISYLIPLVLSLAFIVLVVLLFNVSTTYFFSSTSQSRLTQPLADFQVESPTTFLLLNGKPTRLDVGNTLKLNHQEGLMTGAAGRLQLALDHDQLLRLDEFTTILASWTDGKKYFGLEKGNIWYEGDGDVSPYTYIKTPFMEVKPQGKSTFFITNKEDKQQLAVFTGEASVVITDRQGKEIEKKTIQSGEQMDVVLEGDTPVVKVQPSTVYDLAWVQYNRGLSKTSSNGSDASENTNSISEKSTLVSDTLNEEKDVSTKDTLTKPSLTTILPKNHATFPSAIEGRVDASVQKVQVNGFTLQKFVPGSGVWKYQLIEGYNMKSGQNTFTVIGIDEDGKKTTPLTVIVPYDGEDSSTKNTNVSIENKNSNSSLEKNTNTSSVKTGNSNTNTVLSAPQNNANVTTGNTAPVANTNMLAPATVPSGNANTTTNPQSNSNTSTTVGQ